MFANFEDMQRREQAIRENTIQNKMKRVEAIMMGVMEDETIPEEAKAKIIEVMTELSDVVAIATGGLRNQQKPKPSVIIEH